MRIDIFTKLLVFFSIAIMPINFASDLETKEIEFVKPSNKLEIDKSIKSDYILGVGDLIRVEVLGINLLTATQQIDLDGYITLPEIGKLNANGYTLREFKNKLTKKYEEILYSPNIQVYIERPRIINVYISGEIKVPGLYQINPYKVGNLNPLNPVKIFDVIQKGRGITNYADLSKITIIRKNSISQGSGKIKANINLMDMLIHGNQEQNIPLRDGDSIIINRSDFILKEQLLAFNRSNMSPLNIYVYITGNVMEPGMVEIIRGSSLNQAIASSGGKKLLTGKIEFLRFNADGSNTKRVFKFAPNAKLNSTKNPILMDGDIINVQKTLLGNTTTILNEISQPVLSGYGLIKLIGD